LLVEEGYEILLRKEERKKDVLNEKYFIFLWYMKKIIGH
jgi:hypothetical protein